MDCIDRNHLINFKKKKVAFSMSAVTGTIHTDNTDMISVTLTLCSSQQAIAHVECAAYPDSPISLPPLLLVPDTPDVANMS